MSPAKPQTALRKTKEEIRWLTISKTVVHKTIAQRPISKANLDILLSILDHKNVLQATFHRLHAVVSQTASEGPQIEQSTR